MSKITGLIKSKPSCTSLRIQSFSENECNGSDSVSHNKRRRGRPHKPVLATPASGADPSDSTPHSETSSIMSVLTDPEHSTHSTDTRRTRRFPRRFANLYSNVLVSLPPDVRDNADTRDADYQPARWFTRQYSASAPESEAHDAAAPVRTPEAIASADDSNGASVHSESRKPTRRSRKKAKTHESASSHSTSVSPISSQKRQPESRSAELATSQRREVPTSSRSLSRRHANANFEEESRAKPANSRVRPPAKRRFLARLFDASEPFAGDLLNGAGAGANVCLPLSLPPSLPDSSVVQISPNALLLRPSPKLHSPAARNSPPDADVKDVKTAGAGASHKRAAKTECASSERRQLDVNAGEDAVDFVDAPHLVVSECLLPEVSSDDSDDGAAPRADGRTARSSRSDSDADADEEANERTRVHVGRLVQPQLADVDVGERETRLRLMKPQLPAPLSPSTLRSRAATRKTMQAAAPWLCALCHKSYGFRYELPGSELSVYTHAAGGESTGGAGEALEESVAAYSSLSELYGPYRVSLPDADRRALLAFGSTANGNGSTGQSSTSAAASPSAPQSPPLSPLTARSSQSSAKARIRPVEVWFHSECILWATNVYWNGKELIGLDEAISSALHLTCSLCGESGAHIRCTKRGCSAAYHFHCARISRMLHLN